ncbi:MAG TPA: hypothetical protein VFY79_09515 [Dehalococcoidia bacterium]|nr:hypothetical protein [Dehalococcoidia bacterium]
MQERNETITIALDADDRRHLRAISERTRASETAVAHRLLSHALNYADVDAESMAEILEGIPGAIDRIAEARAQLDRGEGIPLEDL